MEAACSPETSVEFQRHYIPEDKILQSTSLLHTQTVSNKSMEQSIYVNEW
jgi:hypothetical protein